MAAARRQRISSLRRPSAQSTSRTPFFDPPTKTTADARMSWVDCAPPRNGRAMPACRKRPRRRQSTTNGAPRWLLPEASIREASRRNEPLAWPVCCARARSPAKTRQRSLQTPRLKTVARSLSQGDFAAHPKNCWAKEKGAPVNRSAPGNSPPGMQAEEVD